MSYITKNSKEKYLDVLGYYPIYFYLRRYFCDMMFILIPLIYGMNANKQGQMISLKHFYIPRA